MSAPFLWIVVPAILSIALIGLYQWRRVSLIASGLVSTILALLSLVLPIDQTFAAGPFSFQVDGVLNFLGRQLILRPDDALLIFVIYAGLAFWLIGATFISTSNNFPIIALGGAALMVAAFSVSPFLYASLIIEILALLFVPLLVVPQQRANRGILRFISFITISVPFILFVGWMVTTLGTGIASEILVLRAASLIGIGFVFLFAIFPFHSWVPMLMQQARPYPAAFVIYNISLAAILFAHGLLERFDWLSGLTGLLTLIAFVGIFMTVVNGVLSAFQRHLGRMLGYLILAESGFSLVATSLINSHGSQEFYALLIPRMLAVFIFAFGLGLLEKHSIDLQFTSLTGLFQRMPAVATAILIGQFGLFGLPLLGSFPVKISLLEHMAPLGLVPRVWIAFGVLGSLSAGLQILAVFLKETSIKVEPPNQILRNEAIPITIVAFLLFFLGLMPGLMYTNYLGLLP